MLLLKNCRKKARVFRDGKARAFFIKVLLGLTELL